MDYMTIDEYLRMLCKNNPDIDRKERKELKESLRAALRAKASGAMCDQCWTESIWAAMSAITGNYFCHTCATGQWDDDGDIEIYDEEIEKDAPYNEIW